MFSFRAGLKKKPEEPFLSFVVPLELCVKCYAFVFKSELLRQRNTPYHITVVITNLKKKNPCLRQEKQFFIQQENIQCSIGKGFSAQERGFSWQGHKTWRRRVYKFKWKGHRSLFMMALWLEYIQKSVKTYALDWGCSWFLSKK